MSLEEPRGRRLWRLCRRRPDTGVKLAERRGGSAAAALNLEMGPAPPVLSVGAEAPGQCVLPLWRQRPRPGENLARLYSRAHQVPKVTMSSPAAHPASPSTAHVFDYVGHPAGHPEAALVDVEVETEGPDEADEGEGDEARLGRRQTGSSTARSRSGSCLAFLASRSSTGEQARRRPELERRRRLPLRDLVVVALAACPRPSLAPFTFVPSFVGPSVSTSTSTSADCHSPVLPMGRPRSRRRCSAVGREISIVPVMVVIGCSFPGLVGPIP